MSQVYLINKGVGRSIEFKGLKAQYIWYLAIGIAALLVLFAFLYILGINMYVCLTLIGVLGSGLYLSVYKFSHTYGEYGLMKTIARRSVPKNLKGCSARSLERKLICR